MESTTTSYVAPQLDYHQYNYSYPVYKLSKILPLSAAAAQTISAAGGDETLFELPPKVINLSRSYLSFTYTPPLAVLNHTTWLASDIFPFIRQIQLYTRGGVFLADINNFDNYTKAVWKSDTKLEDYLCFDPHHVSIQNGQGGVGQMLRRNNFLSGGATIGSRYGGAAGCDISYTEPMYQISSDLLSTGANNQFLNIKLDMSMIKNTLFAVDHDLYFDEVIVMRIVWTSPAKYCYDGTSLTNPALGAIAIAALPASVTALQMFLAIETNQEVANQIKAKKNSPEGLQVLMPYVYGNKVQLTAGSVAVSLRFNRGHGLRLLKIYHQPTSTTETSGLTSYLTSNVSEANLTDFYTLLNGVRLQEFNVNCNQGEDWMLLKDRLRGSLLQSRNIYQYNWEWIEEFSGYVSPLNENLRPDDDNFIKGIDLSTEQKWDIYITQAAAALNHFTFAVTQKQLIVGPSGIQVM